MTSKHMKSYPLSPVLREMQVENTTRYFYTPIGMAEIQKSWSHNAKMKSKWDFFIAGGNAIWRSPFGIRFVNFLQAKHTLTTSSSDCTSRYLPSWFQNVCAHETMGTLIATLLSKLEVTKMSSNGWIDEQMWVNPSTRILSVYIKA